MSVYARTAFNLYAIDSAASPLAGGVSVTTAYEQELTNGTTANKADLVHKSNQTISGSGNADIDLRALEDVNGDAMTTLTEVVELVLESPPTNGDVLSIKPAASNGWTALLADATDIIKLQPGGRIILLCAADGAYAVGAADKVINVANADSSAATLTLTLIGRSA